MLVMITTRLLGFVCLLSGLIYLFVLSLDADDLLVVICLVVLVLFC